MARIFKILTQAEWSAAQALGHFPARRSIFGTGSCIFPPPIRLEETARRHFAGQADLLLVAFEAEALGDKLVFEPSRGGALFPHLYAPLPVAAALWAKPLPIDSAGFHVFPSLDA